MIVAVMMRNNLREIRRHEGLSIAKLSRLSDISERTIRELEGQRVNSRYTTKQSLINGINKNPNRTKEYEYEEVFPNG